MDRLASALATTRFTGQLKVFQLRDLAKLHVLPHGANYSVPGSGKTAVTYALHELEQGVDRVDQLLVIAPLSAFEAWREEAAHWLDPSPVVGLFTELRTAMPRT